MDSSSSGGSGGTSCGRAGTSALCAPGGATPGPRAAAPRISDPLAELPGGGRSAKHAQDCVELCLSRRGIERLSGFQRLASLQALWLDGNALAAVERLDANTRLRELYLHGNQICTLKGSLPRLRALTHLDLGDNQLRDLPKVLGCLAALPALRCLKLQGNPCCEEPGYRLQAIGALPQLQVLDWHQVTGAERRAAALSAGRGAAALAAPFGRTLPRGDAEPGAAWRARAPERSVLQVELAQAAARVRAARHAAQEVADAVAYASNPDAAFWEPRASLPPPAAVELALQESMRWRRCALQSTAGGSMLESSGGCSGVVGATGSGRASSELRPCSGASAGKGCCHGRRQQLTAGYVPRDLLVVTRHARAARGFQITGTPAHQMFGTHWASARDAVRV